MNEALVETEAHQDNNELEAAAREEESRLKFAELRDGLRQVLQKRGLLLEAGVSNSALVSVLSQAIGSTDAPKYDERLDTDWQEEYQRLVRQIHALMGSAADVETEPRAVIDAVEQKIAA